MSETTAAALHRRGVLARNMPRAGAASRLPFFYFHGDYEGGGFYCLALAGHTGPDQPFYALAPPGHDGGPIPPDVPASPRCSSPCSVASSPRAPYRLGGYCNGGLVAFEIARRLVAAGEQVERLVLIAPVVPTAGGPLARLADRGATCASTTSRRCGFCSASPWARRCATSAPGRARWRGWGRSRGAGCRCPATADGRSAAAQRDVHAERALLPPCSV